MWTAFFKGVAKLAGVVPGWLWAAVLAVVLLVGGGFGYAWRSDRDALASELQALRVQTLSDSVVRTELARRAEVERRERARIFAAAQADIDQGVLNEKQVLADRIGVLLGQLRERPQRAAGAVAGGVPGGAAGGVGCTGAQLYREDGEFLAREAARADRVRIGVAACQKRYDAAVSLTAPGGGLSSGFAAIAGARPAVDPAPASAPALKP